MALEGLAADVDVQQVHALLLARQPAILDPASEEYALFESEVKGITTEVVAVTGAEPPAGAYRDLAVRTIEIGVAAQIEYALFPEQQLGDGSRGAILQARYERLLAQLGASSSAGGDVPTTPVPQGDFPPACPDPLGFWPCYPNYYTPGYTT
ncbi:hypothetical protein [Nocardioides sp.]|uniref:hypothetical protein n=1 Tax=Nocardioides sp. TaxID=35761 RepID=UPI0026036C38|nr:hypothetical protein [Nocardioides sp.]MDI6911477.1 hypothetical protein [Nocardioides sp.]